MQIGDPLVGVDHREGRPGGVLGGDVGLDRRPFGRGRASIFDRRSPKPLLRLTPSRRNVSACFSSTSAKKTDTAWPKRIGSETFIIVALRWTENSTPCPWRPRSGHQEGAQRPAAHHRRVDDLAGLQRDLVPEDRHGAVLLRRVRSAALPAGLDGGRDLGAVEVAAPCGRRGSSSRATRRPSCAGGCGHTA